MIRKLLIANRGEIACRIARTARSMGIATVAVYSDVDAHALHVDVADESFLLGPAPARESYLAIDKLIEIARRSGADAVHPGYGFLSENADFADACAASGLTFVGPPAQAMRLLGSKSAAKAMMARIGVPTVPGFQGVDDRELMGAAASIGFPLLVKAAAGGGGRGMRIVVEPDKLPLALESARREALAAFGDGALLIEKFLAHHKHVEFQIFADAHGEVVTFFERDCSLQRRHQKIIEETPAPVLMQHLRGQMSDVAIRAARAAGYIGAGTVEFLTRDDEFYFLEMNARLQVEHPVTEMIAGQDLVEWQLLIACGARIPMTQDELKMRGCAIEARVCAEDPAQEFRPSVGEITHFRAPIENSFVRIDSGVRRGDFITPYYDSLIAKIIVFDKDRPQALCRLQRALSEIEIVGVATNLDLLRAIAESGTMALGDYDTQFVESNFASLTQSIAPDASQDRILLAAASAMFLADARRAAREASRAAGDEWSPWGEANAWRLHDQAGYELIFKESGRALSAHIIVSGDMKFILNCGVFPTSVEAEIRGDRVSLRVDGAKHEVGAVAIERGVIVILRGCNYILSWPEMAGSSPREGASDDRVLAPMPATVTRVSVQSGDAVIRGDPLVVLEAMKMEITLSAPRDGVVKSVDCVVGDMAREGAELVTLREKKPA